MKGVGLFRREEVSVKKEIIDIGTTSSAPNAGVRHLETSAWLSKVLLVCASLLLFVCFQVGGAAKAWAQESLAPGAEYSITATLSCPVKAGPVDTDFGSGLVKSASIAVDKSGNALLKVELQSHKGAMFGQPYTAFVSQEEGQYLGYKNKGGSWAKVQSVSKGEKLEGKAGSVPQVTSFSFPIEGRPAEYSMGVFVNNAVNPTQFGYNGTSEPKYAATLSLDWSSLRQTKAPDASNGGDSSGGNAGSGSGGNAGSADGTSGSGSGDLSNQGSGGTNGGTSGSGSDSGSGSNGKPGHEGAKKDDSDSKTDSPQGTPSKTNDPSLSGSKSKVSTYSYGASFRKLSSFGTKSICDGLFSSLATVVVSGKLAKVTVYVIDPIPNFKQEGTPLSNVKFIYKSKSYKATYASSHKVKKSFSENALFIPSAGTYSATPISVVLPVDAVKASATGGLKCEAYVRAVIKSTQGFYVSLSGGRLVSVSESKSGLKSSPATNAGSSSYSQVNAGQSNGVSSDDSSAEGAGVGISASSDSSELGGVSVLNSEETPLTSDEPNGSSSFSMATSTPVFVWVMLAVIGLFLAVCVVRFFVKRS